MARDMAALLEQYGAAAEGEADKLAVPAFVPQPTQVHRNLVDLLDSIIGLAATTQGGHPGLRAALRTVRHLRPVALEELARVPEDEVRQFLRQLVNMIEEAIGGQGPEGIARAGEALAAAAGARPPGGGDPGREIDAG